ncbi:MAG TPA: cytochrome c-type biogenesis protein CcmH [Terriglobales bacterium]|nr:cytochrome c-type biogenesis protein CcmH [Terriglobales bacterium]
MPSGSTFHWGRRAAGVLLIAVVSVLLLGAGDTPVRFNTLGHKMMCRCGCNQVLLECNHVGCTYSETMRSELMAGLDRGDSDDLILQGFVQKYGMTVLAAPPTSGFSIVAWIMPFVVLSIGVFLVVIVVRTWKGRPIAAPATVPVSSDQLDNFRRRAREETDL